MRSLICGASVVFLGAIGLAGVPANTQQVNSPTVFSHEEDSFPGAVALPECARTWLARDAHVSGRLDIQLLALFVADHCCFPAATAAHALLGRAGDHQLDPW